MQNLKERTFLFAKLSIDLTKKLSKESNVQHISQQFFRCATSIEANYREADGADSRREFTHRIGIAKKEAKESYYWLGLLDYIYKNSSDIHTKELIKKSLQEAKELTLIFSKIIINLKNK